MTKNASNARLMESASAALAMKNATSAPADMPGKWDPTLTAEISRHKVLDTAETAAFLNFSVSHLRRLYRKSVDEGGIPPPILLSTRKLGWRVGDLIDWLATRQTRPIAALQSTEAA